MKYQVRRRWDLEQTRTHSPANEIDTIGATTGPVWEDPAHDEAGNMTTMPQPYDLTESYTAVYDAWNRLIELEDDDTTNTVAEYRYDGQHRRIVAEVYDEGALDETRYFHYSAQWQVIEERVDTGSGGNAGDLERQFVWGLEYVDELVVRFRDTTGNQELDETLYVLCDTNYRITAIVDDNGAVQERYAYSPYGQRTVLNDDWSLHTDPTFGSHAFRYGHQGLRHDPETGLVYNRWRYLHTSLGRFVQRDPSGYPDGLNKYAGYHILRGGFDPLGLECEECTPGEIRWISWRIIPTLPGQEPGDLADTLAKLDAILASADALHLNPLAQGESITKAIQQVFGEGVAEWLGGKGKKFLKDFIKDELGIPSIPKTPWDALKGTVSPVVANYLNARIENNHWAWATAHFQVCECCDNCGGDWSDPRSVHVQVVEAGGFGHYSKTGNDHPTNLAKMKAWGKVDEKVHDQAKEAICD